MSKERAGDEHSWQRNSSDEGHGMGKRKVVVKGTHSAAHYIGEARIMLREKLDKSEKSVGALRRAGLQAGESCTSHGSESRSQCWGYHERVLERHLMIHLGLTTGFQ